MNSYLKEMEALNADGIDFMDFDSYKRKGFSSVIYEYTKEEFAKIKIIPRTPYRFWKKENGKKVYLT